MDEISVRPGCVGVAADPAAGLPPHLGGVSCCPQWAGGEPVTSTGYMALTDPEWFAFLSARSRVDEVNFWQPGGGHGFKAIRAGEPFFFKLRAPLKSIAGFGFFQRYESLPISLAWDCFGEMNGAPDFETMHAQISALRRDSAPGGRHADFEIGCIMLSAPVFFSPAEWVAPPADWAKTGIQQGKRYALDAGEGSRVWRECLDRAVSGTHYWNVEPAAEIVAPGAPRYGNPLLVRPRLGQGLFSLAVRDAYARACAVTGEHSMPVLEAAHIKPYGQGGAHRVDNGLLLRSDLHRLYDRGYVTIDADYRFRVGDSLRAEFQNGRSYYGLDGTAIRLPSIESWKPDRALLDWHAATIFKG